MTTTAVIEVRRVQRLPAGPVHAAFTISRTACGSLITRAFQVLPGRSHAITCPACQHLLTGRIP